MIKQGVKAVPQMRFILAVGAIMGTLSVIVSILKLDLRLAVFGALLIIVLMSLTVVFARISALQEALRAPAMVMAWFSMILMIGCSILLVTSVFWAKPLNLSCWLDSSRCSSSSEDPYARLRTPAENQVIGFMDKIGDLRQYLLSLRRYPDSREKLAPAKGLADAITAVPDDDLNPTRRYIKREYGALGYMMAAAAEETDPEKHKKFCSLAINLCDEDLSALGVARQRYAQNPKDLNAKLLVEWVPDDQSEDRVLYFRTEALCMRGTSEKNPTLVKEANSTWTKINTSYKSRYPASGTDELVGCISEQ
jgi:hypothetical protein